MQTTTDPIALAAKILTAYVARNSVPATGLPDLIRTVHGSLAGLTTPPKPVLAKPTDAQIRASIRRDTIVSFEDGKPYKALRRHLTLRGLSPRPTAPSGACRSTIPWSRPATAPVAP